MDLLTTLLKVVEQALPLLDYHYRTKNLKRYKVLMEILAEENAKPVYGNLPVNKLRDQNKIDRTHLQIKLLLDSFLENKKEEK